MTPTATPTRRLSNADTRRDELVDAAMLAFAERGFYGTPTTDIARAAGISQAYVFRLFGTKTELFVAVVERCFEKTLATFRAAAEAAPVDGQERLRAMGEAYVGLLADRTVLLGQFNAYTASSDPAVRAAVHAGFAGLFDYVKRQTAASDADVKSFFAHGMLLNVLAAMHAEESDSAWAHALLTKDEC